MDKKTKQKIRIAEKAAEFYPEDPSFTFKTLADELKMDVSDLYRIFPNRRTLFHYFYVAQLYKYRENLKEIEDYESYTLSEKLSNLALTLTDLMLEHREFVEQTFGSFVCRQINRNEFGCEMEKQIRSFMVGDSRISSSASIFLNSWIFKTIRIQYEWLILYWLKDESEGFENTLALTDKWTTFLEEVLYSHVLDKGFDLAKFFFQQSKINQWFVPEQEWNQQTNQTGS